MSLDAKRLDKIQALLAQAESTNHPEEARTFTEKAQALMTEWQIDEAELAKYRHASSTAESVSVSEVWFNNSPYQTALFQLINVAAKANDCSIVLSPGILRDEDGRAVKAASGRGWQRGTTVLIYGFETGRHLTQMLYASPLLEVEHEYRSDAVQTRMLMDIEHPGQRMRWKNAFTVGYANGVHLALNRAKQEATDSVPGSALVLASRSAQVDRYVKEQHCKLRNARGSAGRGAGSAGVTGYEAGQRADTGQTAGLGQSTRQALR